MQEKRTDPFGFSKRVMAFRAFRVMVVVRPNPNVRGFPLREEGQVELLGGT